MKRIDTRLIWRAMPLIPVFCSIYQSLQPNASLALLAFSFCAAKCMDYSFRSVANEMVRLNVCKHLILSSLALIYSCLLCVVFYQVYVPLDFESRYVVSHYTDTLAWSSRHFLMLILTMTLFDYIREKKSLVYLEIDSARAACRSSSHSSHTHLAISVFISYPSCPFWHQPRGWVLPGG